MGGAAAFRTASLILGMAALLLVGRGASLPPARLVVSEVVESIRAGRAVPDASWDRLRVEFPEVEEYVVLLRARARMRDLESVSALRSIIGLRPRSPAAFESYLTLARHWASLGDPQADEAYQSALELDPNLETRLEWARHLEVTGRHEDAYQLYSLLLGEYPEAFVGMRRLSRDPIALSEDLVAATFFSDALEVLGDTEGSAADRLRARALAGRGGFEEALPLFDTWVEEDPESVEARMGLARTLARLGRVEESLEMYRMVDSADARLAEAGLLELLGEPEEALDLYRGHVYPIALWRATEILERDGRTSETLDLYDRIAGSGADLADDAAYRLLVLARRLGRAEWESVALERLEAIDGPSFFWELAGGAEFAAELGALPARAGADIVAKAERLEEMGLDAWALEELRFAARLGQGTGLRLAAAEALQVRNHTSEALQIAQAEIQSLSVPAPRKAWQLSYPFAFQAEVEHAAGEFNVDPLLIWSVMRQESRFDPLALSSAEAQGLMQIIPSTRDDIAARLGASLGPLDMFQPASNIRFGAWYLRSMLDLFEGDPVLAVAAYNGGPGNVRTWLDDPMVSDQADFLRWIGSGETREFVQRVMSNYAVYRWLTGM